MWLAQRSARIRACGRSQLIGLAVGLLVAGGIVPAAEAQRANHATVGPGRIVCNASFCELGSAARPKERVRIIVSRLAESEIRRLRKCTGPCKRREKRLKQINRQFHVHATNFASTN